MYILVEENPNCSAEERVFSASGEKRKVARVNLNLPSGGAGWCDVIAVTEEGKFEIPSAQQVEDSSDGVAWLVQGGSWGLRLRSTDVKEEWSLKNQHQWGVPFLVLEGSGNSIEFKKT